MLVLKKKLGVTEKVCYSLHFKSYRWCHILTIMLGTAEDIAVEKNNKKKKLMNPNKELTTLCNKITELE
jgi:hypothetical protein